MFARRECPFETCNRRRLGSHEFGNLRLSQAGVMPGFQHQVEKGAFLALDACNFLAHARSTHQLGNDLIMGSHV